MDIAYFSEFAVKAGFTQAPDLSDVRRAAMALEAQNSGGYVIRPCLVHGRRIVRVDREFLKEQPAYIEIEDCDGLVTDIENVTLTSTHGDCLPIYAYSPEKAAIGLAHAGWKGTAQGIASALIDSMVNSFGCDPAGIRAVIGPGIGRCHFEVSQDAVLEFRSNLSWADEFIFPGKAEGKYFIDLKGTNKRLLFNSGVRSIEVSPVCTYCDTENSYSYRRDGTMNRMLAYIRL